MSDDLRKAIAPSGIPGDWDGQDVEPVFSRKTGLKSNGGAGEDFRFNCKGIGVSGLRTDGRNADSQ